MAYKVEFDEVAKEDIASITDASVRQAVFEKAKMLRTSPDSHKRLRGPLKGYFRVKAIGRWVMVYRVEAKASRVIVTVVGIREEGSRRDAYEIAKKRLGK